MNEAEIAEIRARADAATPGPWRAMCEGNQYLDGKSSNQLVGASRVEGLQRPWNQHSVTPAEELETVSRFKDEDADFIAAARTDVPRLLDAHASLVAQLEVAKERERALREALKRVDYYRLVIESAVRNADPKNYKGILATLKSVTAALRQGD